MNKFTQTMMIVLIAAFAILAQIPTNGLVAWFPFTGNHNDESISGIKLDSLFNSPTLTADRNGVANSAYEFDGNGSSFKAVATSKLPSGSSDITISAWIVCKNAGQPRVIASWGTDTNSQKKEIVFYHTTNNGYLYLGLTNGVDSVISTKFPSGSSSKWSHVAVTIKSGSAKFYINSAPDSARAIAFNIQADGIFGLAIDMMGSLAGINSFGGSMDDIAIYNRALTDQEIAYVKNCKSTKNAAPIFTSTAVTTAKVTETYAYVVTAKDADSPKVTITLAKKPTGMSIDQNNKISWTPTINQTGKFPVIIVATDAIGDSAVQSFELEVTKNTAPTFTSIAPTTGKALDLYVYNVTTKDAENQAVTVTLLVKPTGMSIDQNNKITWTPTNNQAGKTSIQIVAKDASGDTTIQSFDISVEPATSIATAIIPHKILQIAQGKIFYLPNGRICSVSSIQGMIVNKGMKRIMIR
jgi:hypothetical protein